MKKERFISFIEYLREKDVVFVDDQIVYTGLVTRKIVNLKEKATAAVRAIRNASTTQEALQKLSMHLGYSNCLWRLRSDILFREDLIEYIESLGYSGTQVDDFVNSINSGSFKWKFQKEEAYRHLFADDEKTTRWAKAVNALPNRNKIALWLPTEYDNFCKEKDTSFFNREKLPPVYGGMFSPSKRLYCGMDYNESKVLSNCCGTLKPFYFMLVLPSSFTDEALLMRVVREWFRPSVIRPGRSLDDDVVVGRFFKGISTLKNGVVFNDVSLCVATNVNTYLQFNTFANNIMQDLGVSYAYMKDSGGQNLYLLTLSDVNKGSSSSKKSDRKNDKIEEAAERIYDDVLVWIGSRDVVKYTDVIWKFGCSVDVALQICADLLWDRYIDWNGNVIKEKTKCSMCGKQFEFEDYEEKIKIDHSFGLGSKYDNCRFSANLCVACADRLMDTVLPLFKYPKLTETEYDEDLSSKDIDELIAYNPQKTRL